MNRDNLVLNKATEKQLRLLIAGPSHAVMLEGADGIGKASVAERLVTQLLNVPSLDNYPYFSRIAPTGNSISIEAVRGLQHFLELKTIGQKPLRRAAIIEHADSLTIEAQNALLKTLEEPPADSIIVLTAASRQLLLPTIVSRLRILSIKPPAKDKLKDYFSAQGLSDKQFEQAFMLSGGLPGLMQAISENAADHPLLAAVNSAKEILQKSAFERLSLVDELSRSKPQTLTTLQALTRIADVALQQAAAKRDERSLRRWQQILTAAHDTQTTLLKNGQAKIALTNLMLAL